MRARSLVLKQSFDSRLCIARITRRTCLAIDRGVGVARCFDRLRRQGIRRPVGLPSHDVAPAEDGAWYTGQHVGTLGHLDPSTGTIREIPLGAGSAPHGVIVGPDGAAWITDGGQNAIVRVDPDNDAVKVFPLPADRPSTNLNTAAFDGDERLVHRPVRDLRSPRPSDRRDRGLRRRRRPRAVRHHRHARDVWYASLAGSHIAKIDRASGAAQIVEPPTADQGARRVWSDSKGRIWVAEWNAGQVGLHDPGTGDWREWKLPGANPQAYAVYVDERDIVWLTDFERTPSSASTRRRRRSTRSSS